MTRPYLLLLAALGLIIGGIFAVGFLESCRVPAVLAWVRRRG